MNPLVEYFRCPDHLAVIDSPRGVSAQAGYFRFGDAILYGRQAVGAPSPRVDGDLVDVLPAVASGGRAPASQAGHLLLPFDLAEVVDTLRHERYPEALAAAECRGACGTAHAIYYFLRPALPVWLRRHLQRLRWAGWERIAFPRWPVDVTVESVMKATVTLLLERAGISEFPFVWFWPDGAPACVLMTHDVEGWRGSQFCSELATLDDAHGIRSAYQIVPDAPWLSKVETARLVLQLQRRGAEVNVHDLNHDGRLFRDRKLFASRAATINARGRQFGARGFRAAAMYRRQEWFADLDFDYDMSVPNVARLEPQQGGCCTVMPYFVGRVLELPLTTAQDYTVFHILNDYSTALWRRQLDAILAHNGIASFITHPDYLRSGRARRVYEELLQLLGRLRDERGAWVALPSEVNEWWRQRQAMRLVPDGDSWRIIGPGSERARLAWARLSNDGLGYEVGLEQQAA